MFLSKYCRFFIHLTVLVIIISSSCEDASHTSTQNPILTADSKNYFISIPDSPFNNQWKKENTLVIHTLSDPENLHPTKGTSAIRSEINLYTQITLISYNYENGQVFPLLADNIPTISEDGLRYTYTLRKEAVWDDGSPITAEDIAFTLKVNKCLLTQNPSSKALLDNLKTIVIESPTKIQVILKAKHILNDWFWTDFPIMQRRFYDKSNALSKYTIEQLDTITTDTNYSEQLITWANEFNSGKYGSDINYLTGGGAYKVKAWDKENSLILDKKKNHWTNTLTNNSESAETIIYKVNRDPNSTLLELKNQVYDVSTFIDLSTFEQLEENKTVASHYNVEVIDTYNYTYAAFNLKPDGKMHKPLFTDKTVRKALALLCPVDNINKTINHGYNKRAVGPVSSIKSDFNQDLTPIPYSIQEAQRLLTENGWKDTDGDFVLDKVIHGEKVNFEFDLNYFSAHPQWAECAKLIAESYKKVGIIARLNPLEYSVFMQKATTHDFDMLISAWQSSALPDDFAQIWHTTSWKENGFNFTGFGNQETDALIDSTKYCLQHDKRIRFSKQFQRLVYDEQPYIFLYNQARRVVIHKRWKHQRLYFEQPSILVNELQLGNLQP